MPKKPKSLSDLWLELESARETWKRYYTRLKKNGRTTKESYVENGLYRRFKNAEKRYCDAHNAERNALPI